MVSGSALPAALAAPAMPTAPATPTSDGGSGATGSTAVSPVPAAMSSTSDATWDSETAGNAVVACSSGAESGND